MPLGCGEQAERQQTAEADRVELMKNPRAHTDGREREGSAPWLGILSYIMGNEMMMEALVLALLLSISNVMR